MKIRAGARCQLTRLWRENFSAIDVRCLPSRLPSPPPSLPHRQASSSSTCTNKSRASKKGCQQIWRISRVCTSGIWREEGGAGPAPGIQRSKLGAAWLRQAKPDLSRAFQYILLLSLQSASYIQLYKMAHERLWSLWSMSLSDLRGLVLVGSFSGRGIRIVRQWRCVFTKSCLATFLDF